MESRARQLRSRPPPCTAHAVLGHGRRLLRAARGRVAGAEIATRVAARRHLHGVFALQAAEEGDAAQAAPGRGRATGRRTPRIAPASECSRPSAATTTARDAARAAAVGQSTGACGDRPAPVLRNASPKPPPSAPSISRSRLLRQGSKMRGHASRRRATERAARVKVDEGHVAAERVTATTFSRAKLTAEPFRRCQRRRVEEEN